LVQLGAVHQSNGRYGIQSRNWNRIYADFIFEYGNYYLSLKPWYRMQSGGQDDNPDIEKYMGHGEIRAVYAGGHHTLSIMLRNNFEKSNYGAAELNWSFPMNRRVKWFIQYFNGYGESLIDYNARVNRLGLGIAFTDWL
jgi:phospholipase A1